MVTFGFYNSLNGDRKYNAEQMSSIFNGIINDGVFMSIGDHFSVTASEGMTVVVGSGRAWFDSTWTYNDAPLPIEIDASDPVMDRIDLIVLEVNKEEAVRSNSIKVVKGIPSTSPAPKDLLKTEFVTQYALAQINILNGRLQIRAEDITNKVGTSGTPFVTGILQTISIDSLVSQWEGEFNAWFEDLDEESTNLITTYNNQLQAFYDAKTTEFETWFEGIQDIFDQADIGVLINKIDELAKVEFDHYYSLVNKTTTFTKDSEGNTISILESSEEATATTTFGNDSSGNQQIFTLVVPATGTLQYRKTVTITDTTVTESYTQEGKGS